MSLHYLDLYLAEFTQNLQWYVDSLDYAEGWTWFDADGNALSDEAVASMTSADKAQAFIEGRYTKGSTGGMMGGAPGGDMAGGGMMGGGPGGDMDSMTGGPDGTPSCWRYWKNARTCLNRCLIRRINSFFK